MNQGDPAYWEARYTYEFSKLMKFQLFDWYAPFVQIFPMVENIMDATIKQKILILGVGRSNIIETLYAKGYRDITAIDISPTIISKMQQHYESYTGVEFLVMDVRDLSPLIENSFTTVIDKGCLDALFCRTDFKESVRVTLNGLHRVLKMNGILASISHAPKLARVPYFRMVRWAIDASPVIGGGEFLTFFTCLKTDDETLIEKQIEGAEAGVRNKTSKLVSSLDQSMNKSSTTKSGHNSGIVTVTASVDVLAEMVSETDDTES